MDFLEEAFKVFGWKFSVIKSENISWQLNTSPTFWGEVPKADTTAVDSL